MLDINQYKSGTLHSHHLNFALEVTQTRGFKVSFSQASITHFP